MRVFHILIAAVSCISYTASPSEMLLVDKNDLKEIVKCELNCSLCNTKIYANTKLMYDYTKKTSFQNYCYNHFKCSCCSHVFHANCFVYSQTVNINKCPYPSILLYSIFGK
ncbi:hypothetical protein ENBRE01_1659 [Enteropsectra breve]|nr:hypothetical protein ENBRE01_1659 [Enteropsectra breve]